MKHVILGVGAAGITAARTIRRERPADEIIAISKDENVYSRCMLHHFIDGSRAVGELSFVTGSFFEDNNIRWRSGIAATGIDTTNKQVLFNGGAESYDRLLIATGAKTFVPPIEGLADAKNVFGLRDLPDAVAIRDAAANVENIVIIGAGLVGLDAAYALIHLGKKPVIIEAAASILSANLDVRAADVYRKKFETAGCVFKLGRKVTKVLKSDCGAVKSVLLDDGAQFPCELIVLAAGMRPALPVEEKVIVNEYLETQWQDVYAAGDATGLSAGWPNAINQGEVAALNMCNIPTEYNDTFALKYTVNFFSIPALSLGELTLRQGDKEELREDRNRYERIITNGGIPTGVVLLGDISHSGFWQHLIKNKISIADIPKPVWKVSFADSYSLDENGEYHWNL